MVFMVSSYSEWDQYYRQYSLTELGWELGKPRPILVDYMQRGLLPKGGKALDLCCGVATNTIYLAQNGFQVTAIDISRTAITIAKLKAHKAKVNINFLEESFVDLPFSDGEFDFIYDMGCFHHVEWEDRPRFIGGIHRVLKDNGAYMLTCFSYRNGPSWNHFTKDQLIDLFSGLFEFGDIQHYPSVEGDGVTRFFYTVLMKRL
jgi:ubiquinone/menaquinone biosynthesis C-methylase UbiE